MSDGGIVQADEDSTDNVDDTILGGNIDLEAAGLEREDLRRLVLASYVTQATEGTELGVEISYEELQEILNPSEMEELMRNKQTSPDEAGYYYIVFEDENTGETKYFTATRGSVKIQNENEDEMICVNNATFDYYIDWFNEGENDAAAANTVVKMYTVRALGSIEMITYTIEADGSYTFSSQEFSYSEDNEISQCLVPIELLVDFLQISASPSFLSAFEELIRDQEIILRAYTLTTTETVEKETTYPIDITVEVDKELWFQGIDGNSNIKTVTTNEERTYNTGEFNMTSESTSVSYNITFDVVLVSADTWYMKAEREVTKFSTTTYEYYNENGEATTFNPSGGSPIDDAPSYQVPGFSLSGITTFDQLRARLGDRGITNFGELDNKINEIQDKMNDTSDVQSTIDYYTSLDGFTEDEGLGYIYYFIRNNPEIIAITAESTGGREKKVKETTVERLNVGTMDYEDNTDAFLGLWKNDTGHYERGETFNPDGEKVLYTDLYSGNNETACVGDLFENGDEMLFEILDFSETTQQYVHVMKYILYRYTGNDYGITDFETLLRLLGLLTVSTGDYNVNTRSTAGENLKIVDTEDGVTAEQHLIDGINNVARYRTAAQNYLPYVDTLIELQERYGVNAAWIVAQGCMETGGGTTGSAITNNNWYGLGYNGSTYYSYNSPEECFEDMAKTVAQTGPYFRDGRETITEISYMWVRGEAYNPETADPDWWYVADGKEIVRDILTGAGIDLSSIMGGEILEVCAQVTDHYNAIGAEYSQQRAGEGPLIWGNIEACWNHPYICCATYVSMVLYQSGLLTADQINAFNYHYTGSGGIPDMLEAAGWHKVSASEMQPGDVLNREAYHVMIYAGNGQVWDQNTCTGAHYQGPFTTNISGYDVWRAP